MIAKKIAQRLSQPQPKYKVGDHVVDENNDGLIVENVFPNKAAALQTHPESAEELDLMKHGYSATDENDENGPWYKLKNADAEADYMARPAADDENPPYLKPESHLLPLVR